MFGPLKLNPMEKTGLNHLIGVFLFLSLCINEVACKAPKRKPESKVLDKQSQNAVKKTTPVFTGKDTCTIEIGKPEILAYMLSQAEFDSIPESGRGDFNESYSDFMYCWHEYANHPGKMRVEETGSRFIRIGDSTLDRTGFRESGFGIILISKSGHFKIVGGTFDKTEVEKNSRFFGL